MFELSELTLGEKEYILNIQEVKNLDIIKNICKINYFGKKVYFYKVNEESIEKNDCWVNYTGLTSYRPKLIINNLINKGILKENMNILDIGCGLSEMGIEINRILNDKVFYYGLDINKNLIFINKINFTDNNNYKFIEFDLTNTESYSSLNDSYDIVFACGAATEFYKIFKYISINIKPKYFVCESHNGRMGDLQNIISHCENYKILDKYAFQYTSSNGPKDSNWIGYKRTLIILELK